VDRRLGQLLGMAWRVSPVGRTGCASARGVRDRL